MVNYPLPAKLCFAMLLFLLFKTGSAQVTILSSNLNPVNVTPQVICQVNLSSQKPGTKVSLQASVYNTSNEELLSVKTLPFTLAAGLNAGNSLAFQMESFNFSASSQGQYLKTNKMLPSGNYKYCVRLIDYTNEATQENCQDVTSDFNSFLTLISPFDTDTISTKNPFLIWNHSESFNILSQGEYFRMTVVEISKDQNAESAINTNNPVFLKEYVNSHNVFYPFEAKELKEGGRYAWQVLKISNGVIINKTEAWEFVIAKPKPILENKYAVLQKKTDAGFYLAENNKVFFKFSEQYVSGELKCFIYDKKHKVITPEVESENTGTSGQVNTKVNGYNRYEIDLSSLNLRKGYYTLEVYNEKNEKYLMKFYVE